MLFNIYIHEGMLKGDEPILDIARNYLLNNGLSAENLKVERTQKGKPYLVGNPAYFSISHSGELWVMMIGPSECGIDIQELEPKRDYTKIAMRMFGVNEQKYIEKLGADGFYRLWVHAEAFVKYTGSGIFSSLPSLTSDEGFLVDCLEYEEKAAEGVETPMKKRAYVYDVPVSNDIFMAYVTGNEESEFEVLPYL